MSPASSSSKVNRISLMCSRQVAVDKGQVFGSLEDSMMQLFTIMFGDVQFSTLKTIMNVNTVASRLAVILACVYALLLLIVLVNLLIAIVDETYGTVKESEADQMLRNKALIIDEIESTLTDAVVQDLNSRVLLPYVHILIPQAARADPFRRRDIHTKLRKLKHFIKERLPEQPLLQPHLLPSAGSDAAAFAAAAGSSAAYQSYCQQQQQQQHNQQLPGGPWSGPGQQQMRQGVPVASSAAAPGQLGAWHGSTQQQQQQQQQQQRGSSHGQAAVGAAALGGGRASHDGGGGAAAAKIQQEIGQLSSSVAGMNQQLEAVAGNSAAAVAELATKVEGLQGEIGLVKELLLALLAKQQ
ncbi:hypothetical protein OEZ86_009594 [Tetradesmus obliquus]|uniref:Polycystin cation channel PKD1/PKD2 domain-containing protein n=1 Tax=Tetradesmus obliquus TaxID=3088 RepID=A0ABY8UM52_TETOB|nr:hypothetical protein OEZ85_001038 [Tetradesmus obliquus]WIA43068.1 hypothetical protein OEZ86_009594 [Tetradesmus obliquus]